LTKVKMKYNQGLPEEVVKKLDAYFD